MTRPLGTAVVRKLVLKDDWELAACPMSTRRTRGGGGLPNGASEDKAVIAEEPDEDSSDEDEEEEDVLVDDPTKKAPKPDNTRVLLEVEQLQSVFQQVGCPKCGGDVSLSLRTICIATSIGMECENKETCQWFFHPEPPAATTIHDANEDNYERTTDYAINVLYILGLHG